MSGIRGVCALAVLPRQMPLLRLQLPCPPRRHRPGATSSTPICRELRISRRSRPSGIVCSIFFGGGTPSLMAADDGRRDPRRHRRAVDASRTMPRSRSKPIQPASRPERFAGYRAAGVNRVSLGVQSLDDASLKSLGRKHTSDEALAALAIAKRNFERVSLRSDLCAAGTDACRPGGASSPRARPCAGSPLALSAHHRGGHAVCRAPRRRRADAFPRRTGGSLLSPDPGAVRCRRAPRL